VSEAKELGEQKESERFRNFATSSRKRMPDLRRSEKDPYKKERCSMSLTRTLHEGWRHFLEALHPDDRQKLVEMLREEYIEEAQDAVQFTRHAQRMYYPQFRERLLRIAAEEHTHVLWLREKILALGGNIPEVSFTPKVGKNSWECLLMDVEEEKRCCGDLLQRMHIAEHADPEIAEGLRRMREDEKLHREQIMDMLMKSDAYALPPEQR
jgi:rubrerythrin